MSEIRNPAYAAKLQLRYGEHFLAVIHSLWTDDTVRLNDVATSYGISREAIRLIFNKLYTTNYSKLHAQKTLAYKKGIKKRKTHARNKRKDLEWRVDNLKGHHQAHALAQMMVHDVCVDLGYEVKVTLHRKKNAKPKLVVNGNRVVVAWASKPHMAGQGKFKWPYWRFGSTVSRWDELDFAVLCAPQNEAADSEILYFVVPEGVLPKSSMIFIRHGKSNYHAAKNRYHEYLGAWHLLES